MPLDAEAARARLNAIADLEWRVGARQRAERLPLTLRPIAAAMLEDEPPPYPRPDAFFARVREASERLDMLSDDDRTAAMAALHPQLAPVLTRWWVDAQEAPYTSGASRMAFRAPGHPEVSRDARGRSLRLVLQALGPYARDITWVAAWAPFVGFEHSWTTYSLFAISAAGGLLASAIDLGGESGDAVYATLVEVGNGEHAIGVMGRSVIAALLRSHREDAWAYILGMLRAAQRQEGLRQAILEAADQATPAAFDLLLAEVLDEDLLRFAAGVRAAGLWVGALTDVEHTAETRAALEQLQTMRRDSDHRIAAVTAGEPREVYAGLCASAMEDAFSAIDLAASVLRDRAAEHRVSAVAFLSRVALPPARRLLIEAIDDEDLAVAWLAHGAAVPGWSTVMGGEDDPLGDALYDALTRLLSRLPEVDKPIEVPGVWVGKVEPSRSTLVARMLELRGTRPLSDFIELIPLMDPWTRERFAAAADGPPPLPDDVRDALLSLVGDRSRGVRAKAADALRKASISAAEAPRIEKLLTRKAGDVRRGALGLLATLPPSDALEAAGRLWSGGSDQRDAACELLGMITGDEEGVTRTAARFVDDGATDHQQGLVAKLLDPATAPGADDPGLGLFDPSRRTLRHRPDRPRRDAPFSNDVARRIVGALDDLAEAHRDTPFLLTTWQGSREVLLADARFLPSPFGGPRVAAPEEEGAGGMVLSEVFRPWWESRAREVREDGLDALRALGAVLTAQGAAVRPVFDRHENLGWWWDGLEELPGAGTLGEIRHPHVVSHVLLWLVSEYADEATVDECLEAVETTCAAIPDSAIEALQGADERMRWQGEWRGLFSTHPWYLVVAGLFRTRPALLSGARLARWFSILNWIDEPRPGASRIRVDPEVLFRAHDEGLASDDDIFDLLFEGRGWMGPLAQLTRHRRTALVDQHPGVVALADRLRDRIVEIELARGDVTTHASSLALLLGSIDGVDTVASLLSRLGKSALVRGRTWGNPSREAVYSHLLQVSYPRDTDTPDALRAAARAASLSDARLLDLAMYSPQWSSFVERALDWDGVADGVWWFHAHTKDERWAVGAELRETWAALSAERTALTSDDLVAGAVDVAWFLEASGRLGPDRWRKLDSVAKLASGGNGHRRAQLFSAAMRGEVDEATLEARITSKRHQDAVRALGLVPLPADADTRRAMLARYAMLREFERGSSKFGAQRRASEQLAVRIGVENLARTAGFPDPQRFVWAMEAAEAGELGQGPLARSADDIVVTLSVDEEGVPQLAVVRSGKTLSAVPGAYRKHADFTELQARKTALTRQSRRVRASLEAAMVRGDVFVPDDFDALEAHPVVAPMLGLLVYVDDDGVIMRRDEGALTTLDGAPCGTPAVRLAHAVDLLTSGEWTRWQEWQFASERRQPFKQLFRELYVLTEAERRTSPVSRRYEGHQVQPRQALALFGSRGWLSDRESGLVSRAFLPEGLVARLTFVNGFLTPAEVELPTIEGVHFTKPHEFLAQPLDAVPARVLSETMRDLDLVVSVAHAGGVDPEASASTVEMRAALVREMTRVMRLDNVRFVGETHVLVEGVLGEYSVHLGSAVVHRRPGGAVCIIPVNSQRRGRLFLPFADDDPKTAEVVSKVLLLARDGQIKDPTILEQLR